MVMDPYNFWDKQGKYGKLSANSLLGQFVVFSGDTEISRKIFNSNHPSKLKVVLHPNAEILLGKDNIAFLQGEKHKELRKRLLPLFTKKALSVYLAIQERAIRDHLEKWLQMPGEIEMRLVLRDLNVWTSQSVFVGPYLTEEQRKEFADNYLRLNEGFLSFPLNFPGTALYKAVDARKKVVATLGECARKSKLRMEKGEEPSCLLDFWMVHTIQEIKDAKENGLPAPPHSADGEIGNTTLDFLFAAQDASTASLVWVMQLLADNPEILKKVRQEQNRVRPNDECVTATNLVEMEYTHRVMKEVLRYRPPATMVPHQALQDFAVTDDFVAPKGSLVIPSVLESAFQGWSNPHTFDPDRFSPERNEEAEHGKNFLTFGTGPHKCMGYQYAMNHIMAFIAVLATNCEWEHRVTEKSQEIVYLPTIYPGDGCV
eukprot:CAMPEP_0117007806 /NCGR_PEP_ID=MMETSP0472-20121206/7555_1 /TAXON_ID=693140 ORGANISM="Tiarina fusus, Strain LIS" /NCGR_SAMPLE_ID=MMETSP0472 /ASSEMBLY_ACC=CAM_ASM_000603 /LENGTH=428 /DNA_ID=CAMNT_0004709681 /DNA_START=167 /DNA_END=1450 /DNA_ORIENTATION=+